MPSGPRLYADLAHLWPLMSPPEDYAEEGARLRSELRQRLGPGGRRLLELGTGGGHLLHHLAGDFDATAVDLSDAMLAHSRRLNPGVTHHLGDMRTVRLGETFDAVLIHDAIDYMTTLEDLRAAIETAWLHCRPGGAALFAPDHLRENFQPSTDCGGCDGEDRSAHYLENTWDPDPDDTMITTDYAFVLRSADGSVDVVHDRHVTGLFRRADWLRLLADAGFEAQAVPCDHSEIEPGEYELFVCRRV